MSYTFTIGNIPHSTHAESFKTAGLPEIGCREEIDLNDHWTNGVFHFYCPGLSCRTIEVTVSDDDFEVRIMAHSSRDDYQMGLNLVHAVASEGGSQIHSEDGDVVSPAEFLSKFNDDWISEMMQHANGTFNMIARQGGTATVNGAIRPFAVGEVMMRKLGFAEDPIGFPKRFFEAMHHAQWFDLSDCFEASVVTVTPKGSGNQRTLSSIGAPGLKYLIGKVDFIAAMFDGEMIFVPWSQAPSAFGDRLTHVHEELVTIEPIEQSDWPLVTAQLQRFATPLE